MDDWKDGQRDFWKDILQQSKNTLGAVATICGTRIAEEVLVATKMLGQEVTDMACDTIHIQSERLFKKLRAKHHAWLGDAKQEKSFLATMHNTLMDEWTKHYGAEGALQRYLKLHKTIFPDDSPELAREIAELLGKGEKQKGDGRQEALEEMAMMFDPKQGAMAGHAPGSNAAAKFKKAAEEFKRDRARADAPDAYDTKEGTDLLSARPERGTAVE